MTQVEKKVTRQKINISIYYIQKKQFNRRSDRMNMTMDSLDRSWCWSENHMQNNMDWSLVDSHSCLTRRTSEMIVPNNLNRIALMQTN